MKTLPILQVIKHKLFFKMLMYFLSLLIPILLIGAIVYLDVNQVVKKDVAEKLNNNLNASIETIDLHLGMAQSSKNNLMISDIIQMNLRHYDRMSDAEKVNMKLVTRALASNQNVFSSFIDHIFLYIDTEKIYTSDGVIAFPVFFEKFYRTSHYDMAFWLAQTEHTNLSELLRPIYYTNYTDNQRLVIPMITTQYINGNRATLVTSVSGQAIERSLTMNSIYPQTTYLVLNQHQDQVVNTNEGDEWNLEELLGTANSELQHRFMDVGGTQSLVVYATSEDFGWRYYSITPVSVFSHEAQGILSLVSWISLVLFLVGIVFAVIFSAKLYNPIRQIQSILTNNEGDDHSAVTRAQGDVLALIGRKVNRLLQENQAAIMKLNQYSSELLDQTFIGLLNGRTPANPLIRKSMIHDMGFDDGNYMCCGFLFQYKEQFILEINENDRILIQDKMKRVIWGILDQHVNCYVVEQDTNFYVAIVQLSNPAGLEPVYQAIDNVKQTFDYDLIYCSLQIGIGKFYPEIEQLSESFSDVLTVLSMMGERSDLQIIDSNHLQIEQTYYYSFLDEKKLINLLRAGNRELLEADVRELVRFNQTRNVSFMYLGMLLEDILNTGIRYGQEKGHNVEQLMAEQDYETITKRLIPPTELDVYLDKLIVFYMRIIDATVIKAELNKTDSIANQVSAYIEQHYAENIYLEHIAQELGFSAKYLSRMFKETVGITITDYIHQVRMKQAKELLANSDLKITEIAEQVGIQSRTTFLRVFKKSEGLSPSDYRNAYKGEER